MKTTQAFEESVQSYISECAAKRKEILDAGKDTAEHTNLPTREDIISDAIYGVGADEDGDYYDAWGVTDNYESDYPFSCKVYIDPITKEPALAADGEQVVELVEFDKFDGFRAAYGALEFEYDEGGAITYQNAVDPVYQPGNAPEAHYVLITDAYRPFDALYVEEGRVYVSGCDSIEDAMRYAAHGNSDLEAAVEARLTNAPEARSILNLGDRLAAAQAASEARNASHQGAPEIKSPSKDQR